MTLAVPALILSYEDQVYQVSAAGTGSIPVQMLRNLENCETEAQKQFKLPPGTYDLYDRFGKIERPEDLQRALDTAGGGECNIEVREHRPYVHVRRLDNVNSAQNQRMDIIEDTIRKAEQHAQTALEEHSQELREYIQRVERKILDELVPVIDELCRDRTQLQKDLRKAQEKLRQINVRELHEMRHDFFALKEQVQAAVKRVDRIDVMWATEKLRIEEDLKQNNMELKELQRYMQGRIDVCVEADADLARNHQVLEQRVKLLADDLGLFRDDTQELSALAAGSREKQQELMEVLTEVRTVNTSLVTDCGHFLTRIRCIEVAGMEEWTGFMPGVIFYKKWSRHAFGEDVQLSSDLFMATGRGNLATTGIVVNADEGLAVADGPCKRYGKPGQWASYFEVEVEEVAPAPAGAGGLFVGLSVQSAQEIGSHPRKEFDGWLMGGPLKALICRYGTAGLPEPDLETPEPLPATWAPGLDASETAFDAVRENVENLKLAMPHRPKCEVRQIDSCWESESLNIGDSVGILFRPKPSGGARMRVCVNGKVVAQHDFMASDSPPADTLGYLTPIVRLAGTGKSVRIWRDKKPPAEMLAS
mmetsp:Transcript_53306/g.155300  ORF Transcript_53306/g.155300 Transcript_53306/m.155300 type:complete len:590 (+) Transcript_53306:112-1881(+)